MGYNADTMGVSTSKSHSTATQQVWVPKGQVPHIQGPFVLLQASSLQTNQVKKYLVPRSLLQCQGYYAGCQQLWLPKDSHQKPCMPELHQRNSQEASSKVAREGDLRGNTSLKGTGYPLKESKPRQIWLLKSHNTQQREIEVKFINKATSTILEAWCQSTFHSDY